jgi:ABC-type spermidine/putrescine transport system permease subunit I
VTIPRRSGSAPGRLRLGAFAVPDIALAVAAVLVPLGVLIAFSFGKSDTLTQDVKVIGSLDAYRTLLGDLYRPVVARSIGLAALTVSLCVAIGTPAALAISRLSPTAQRRMLIAVMLPSFVSFTVRVFAWQGLLGIGGPLETLTGRSWLYTPTGVAMVMGASYLPLYVLPAYVALTRVPRSVLDAGADLGAHPWRLTRSVTLPLARSGLVTGAVLVGVLASGEFIVPTVIGGGKVLLIGKVLSERGAGRDKPLGGAIVVLLLTIFVVLGSIAWLVQRRDPEHAN